MGKWDLYRPSAEGTPSILEITERLHSNQQRVSMICSTPSDAIVQSIGSDRFEFVAQGIFDRSGNVSHRELLARIRIGSEIISPGVFLPVLESEGMTTLFDYKVLKSSFDIIARRGKGEKFCINLNPSTLGDEGYVTYIIGMLLKRYGIDPGQITIEILESERIYDFPGINRTIERLKGMGLSVAVDDFHPVGNNNAFTLDHLRSIDMVKFDGLYVRDLFAMGKTNYHEAQVAICSVLDSIMARSANTKIVFEHIENKEMFDRFKEMDPRIGLFQGYYFEQGSLI